MHPWINAVLVIPCFLASASLLRCVHLNVNQTKSNLCIDKVAQSRTTRFHAYGIFTNILELQAFCTYSKSPDLHALNFKELFQNGKLDIGFWYLVLGFFIFCLFHPNENQLDSHMKYFLFLL